MSVWPSATSLSSREGDLVSVAIDVDPRFLESLLETLAEVSFPINPQIYHDAAMVHPGPDGEECEAVTLVEFPAYRSQLDEVRRALESHGFDARCLHTTGMLEEIQAVGQFAAPLPGATYFVRQRARQKTVGAV